MATLPRVLIVDDDYLTLNAMRRQLQADFDIVVALGANAALASLAGEQYRKLGIRVEALNETLGGQMKVLVVTIPLMGDGKTATAANLAISLAQEEGRRVALVDCDMRNPRIHAYFEHAPQ